MPVNSLSTSPVELYIRRSITFHAAQKIALSDHALVEGEKSNRSKEVKT